MDCTSISLTFGKWCDPSVLTGLIQALATVVTAAFIYFITALYTRETKKIRQNSDLAFYTSISPYLIVGFSALEESTDDPTVQSGKLLRFDSDDAAGRAGMLDYQVLPLSAPRREYFFRLSIVDPRMPNHICCVWFDQIDGRYYFSPLCLEAITEGEVAAIPITNNPFEPKEAAFLLEYVFEDRWHDRLQELIEAVIPGEKFHQLVAFYFDHAGKLYATPRKMILNVNGGTPVFLKTDLIPPPGLEELSPPFESTFDPVSAEKRYEELRNRKPYYVEVRNSGRKPPT